MSTIDPARRRASRSQGGPMAVATALLAAFAVAALGYAFGRGLSSIIDVFRQMAFEGIGSEETSEAPAWWWGLFVGVFGGVAAVAWYTSAVQRARRGKPLPVSGPALFLAGATPGAQVQAQDWTPPARLGFTTMWHHSDAWGPYAWVMYYVNIWLPALLAVGTVVLLVLGVRSMATRTAKTARVEQLISTGRRVPGEVSEASWTGLENHGLQQVRFTVRFVDDDGIQRWVTKKGTFDPTALPRVGMAVTVLYDPHDLREDAISVAMEPPETVERLLQQAGVPDSSTSLNVTPTSPAPDGRPLAVASPAISAPTTGRPVVARVLDAILTPDPHGTEATLTVEVAEAGRQPVTGRVSAVFASGSPRLAEWGRIGAQVPVTISADTPPRMDLDLERA